MFFKISFLIAAFVGSTCTNYIIKFITNKLNKRSSVIVAKQKRDISVNNCLLNITESLGAYRTAIIRYKDGLAFMDYESPGDAKNSIQQKFQGIRTSALAAMLLELEQKGSVEVRSELGDRVALLHHAVGIETSYKYRIHNSITEGCLVVAFNDSRKLTESELNIIQNELTTLRLINLK